MSVVAEEDHARRLGMKSAISKALTELGPVKSVKNTSNYDMQVVMVDGVIYNIKIHKSKWRMP